MYSRIESIGSFLPENIITNQDLEKRVDTSDEWIRTRTGIKQRSIANENQATSDLALEASREAIKKAEINPKEIDLIIVGTCTPDGLKRDPKREMSTFGATIQTNTKMHLFYLEILKLLIGNGMK